MTEKIKKIVVVGGGTAGWISAACLCRIFARTGLRVELIESPNVPTVGVGEATIPPIIDFIKLLGIDFKDFIKRTDATFKLGIEFINWRVVGHSYWHQFGSVGANIDSVSFYQHWLKCQRQGLDTHFTDYSPSIAMAKQGRFVVAPHDGKNPLSGSKYAWHFDAVLVAQYLAEYCKAKGVKHTLKDVVAVNRNEQGFISDVVLENNNTVIGDFYIDCTGSQALLINKTMAVGFDDWSRYLLCDSAVVAQTKNTDAIEPYTVSTALNAGWQWRIPLQARVGNGYVYSSRFVNDDVAEHTFLQNIVGDISTPIKKINFQTGCRKKLWEKNCLAIGLSSGFLEPLESTSIHLIVKGISLFAEMFPNTNCAQSTADEYNRIMLAEYKSIRDFIVLHYCTTHRVDTEFWRYCRNMDIPKSLANKLDIFRSQGRLFRNEFDLFSENSWYAVLEGMGVRPEGYDPLVDNSNFDEVKKILSSGIKNTNSVVNRLPSHAQFIKDNGLNRI